MSNESNTITSTLRLGEYAQGKGGFFVGVIRDGDKQWNLFASPMDVGYIKSKWSDDYNEIEGEFSRRDGQHNTNLILASEPDNKIANHCTALTVDGHKDFYWPSEFEQNLICINLPDQSKPEWHWSSTQYSAYRAWGQYFEDGNQDFGLKYHKLAARAVRRELII